MYKKTVGIMAAAALSALFATTSFAAGWTHDEHGYWYQYEDGGYAQNGVKTIDGVNYAFDEQGYMLKGWQYLSFHWYYFDEGSGAQAIGWREIGGKWYYFEPENGGNMHTSWLDLGKKRYYFNENGVMQTGVFYLSDSAAGSTYAYQADENGVLIRNTVKENGNKTILYDENGVMMYRNNTTRQVSSAEGGSTWQYVLNESDMQGQKDDNQQIITTAAQDKQDVLYDDYKKRVNTARTKSREKRIADWEEKARRELATFLSAAEIEEYITRVKQGRFCRFKDREPWRDHEWYDDFYYENEEAEAEEYYYDYDYDYDYDYEYE